MSESFDAKSEIMEAIGEDILQKWASLPDGPLVVQMDKRVWDNLLFGSLSLINLNAKIIQYLARHADISTPESAAQLKSIGEEYVDFAKSYSKFVGLVMLRAEADHE